ncbi:MAG: deoxyuridine 5'-triphosphate nucleotidohydrolase [Acidobacteria bacterium 13_1_40CM_2_68_5]|nr:MAG: deoxyuridine 5'-triphosphate nucleotidohydrolase [Acidobacteria bacterium 13_1_40CM_2_68_5]OLE66793.1 MAG: deoxyuridine 5'-triphosphate nucleotidohydrolase [Acidobacteria bacterium 13_1_20CM_2_68_7]
MPGAEIAVPVFRTPENPDLPLPEAATPGSAGLDLRACVPGPVVLQPGRRVLIPTGFCVALPPGYEGQVRPRSGLALRHGLTMLNSPGTIDSDYRGEIAVVAVNLGQEPVTINRGDRIAQLVIAPVARARLALTAELPPSGRGVGGFGHTGST